MKNFLKVNMSRYILLLVLAMGFPAWLSAQKAFPAESLKSRIERIASTSGKNIVYDDKSFGNIQVAAVNVESSNINTLLTKSLASTGFTFKTMPDNSIVIKKGEQKPTQSPAPVKGKGSLSGTVLDEAGQPVTGVIVSIPGTTIGIATDADGKYTLRGVPEGTTKMQFAFMGYETQVVSDVKINANRATPLDIVLKESSQQLGEVVVTATYNQASANGLYAKQKNMAAMSDGVSADMIKKTSDNNVAQVLKRVSGVTIDDGKYVTVRGLSERYNNVQLNGSALPSTEPNRRNFSFDVIPTGLVDNVTINKTFTPDMQGEFTGGLVEIKTLAIPKESIVSINVGTGMNTISTGKDFRSNKRFGDDYLFGNGRGWYGKVWNPEMSQMSGSYNDLTNEQKQARNQMDARVPNYWEWKNFKGAPTQSYAITAGMPLYLGNNNTLGVIASLTYRHEENTNDLKEGTFLGASIDTLIAGKQYTFTTSTGTVVNVGWERPGHKITWNNLFNNRFTHTNLERAIQMTSDILKNQMNQYSTVQINRLWQTQFSGEHHLPKGLLLSWMADYNKMTRTTPDDRSVMGAIMNDPSLDASDYLINWQYPFGYNFTSGFQMYSKLQEEKENIALNFEYPFNVVGNKQKLKAGYLGTFRQADFKRQYLQTLKATDEGRNPYEDGLSLADTYSPDLYANGKLYLQDLVRIKDYYKGNQQIHAAYLMGDFTFWRKLHLTAGVRMEAGNMETTSMFKNTEGYNIDTTMVRKKTDLLPAATMIYNITDNLNVRAAYGKTIARPDFRELAVSHYFNVEDRLDVYNVAGVKQTYIDNADLRLEWYPGTGEVVSISGFYKRFKDPVELLTVKSQVDMTYALYTLNLHEATALGMEVNLRKSLDFIAPGSFLKDLYLNANATILKGDVKYNTQQLTYETIGLTPPEDVVFNDERKRPLQGLSPYTVNAGLQYDGNRFGAAINYNRVGRKMVVSGMEAKYDQYENPRDVLDLQLSVRLLKKRNLELKLNASDLFNQDIIVYQNTRAVTYTAENPNPENGNTGTVYLDLTNKGDYNPGDWVMSRIKKGINLTLGVSYKF